MQKQIIQPPRDSDGAFARIFPKTERWMQKRRLIKELEAESDERAGEAAVWEGRRQWEKAGRLYEEAAGRLRLALDVRFEGKRLRRMEGLLSDAMVCLHLELTEAARYDPVLHWRMSRIARMMGDAKRTVEHFKRSCDGFSLMVSDRNVDSLVRLNRLKRRFIEEVWEGAQEKAFATGAEAIAVSKGIRTPDGKLTRESDTRRWLEAAYSERFGEPYLLLSAIYGDSVLSRP